MVKSNKTSLKLAKLAVGKSLFIADKTPYELRNDIYPAANSLGYTITAKQDVTRNGTSGTRVWRKA